MKTSQAAQLTRPVKGASVLHWCQLMLCNRHKQTSAEQHIHRPRGMHNGMPGGWPWCPQQSQSRHGAGFLCKCFELPNARKQISLLFLQQHGPWKPLLQTPQSSMPLTAGEQDAGAPASSQVAQSIQRGFGVSGGQSMRTGSGSTSSHQDDPPRQSRLGGKSQRSGLICSGGRPDSSEEVITDTMIHRSCHYFEGITCRLGVDL